MNQVANSNSTKATPLAVAICMSLAIFGLAGCGKQDFVNMGTAGIGGAFQPVGNAISDTLNENKGENTWKVQAKATKGSQENIRRIQDGEYELGLSNSAISYFAVRGEEVWEQEYDIRAVVTIAPNVGMFVTKQDSGIKTMADLKGKRVVMGPAGAGFDMFLKPLLEAHGVKYEDFEQLNNTQNGSVDMLADGNADAAFLGGALPNPSITRACNEMDIHFIPFDETALDQLQNDYLFFQRLPVKAESYGDLTEDFNGLNVGSMHLITSANYDEETVYQLTKTIWENRESIGHPAKKFINEQNAARNTGTPFHPGAQRFYEEIGIWPDSAGEGEADDDSGDDDAGSDDS